MASAIGFLKRNYNIFFPPVAIKNSDVLRFGILGAANIAPLALITPAKSHPDVIIAAVAARDPKKAEAYAKKHGIPIVHKTYDDLIADPSIDCIYNPLPNGLHYEWTMKALKAGKHVLVEKPSTSNAIEAKSLFRHPLANQPNGPIVLEAFHYRFHPAWQFFLTLFDSKDVEHVKVINELFAGAFKKTDIRFVYSLAGGTLMDFGTYALSALRQIFGTEPSSVKSGHYRPMPEGLDKQIDEAIYATYEFPNGGTADITADLQKKLGFRLHLMQLWLAVTLKPKTEQTEDGNEMTVQKEIKFKNYMGPYIYHSIDITTVTEIKDPSNGGKIVKEEKKTERKKVYKWLKDEEGKKGEEWWSTYRHQLEAFVDRIKKREGSGVWVDGEDSIKQMEMIDATYLKVGLPVRPTSKALDSSE
ncbi:oxidoreductase domain-containing protein [Lojkania enalia]|uniref:D-xylose 1-dehydrogenase (NADP(+), D-xylono-1,5-lactone-forming) n=1 Tax=Lojkania enalia TaxID=147567 RepID=A0A9P4N004_9PLEO|nr:oxidoreductase domain-containing protein [Didymosphaeria enalia]